MKGAHVLVFAKRFIGAKYVFGAFVPKNAENWKGPFDCAEFVAYCNFRVFGILYGCDTGDVAKAANADSYTGYFDRDAQKLGRVISVEQAARTPGAMLVRPPVGSAIGHIAFSNGDGKTTEAHSTKYGVINSVVIGRRWSYGLLLPGVEYETGQLVQTDPPSIVYRLKKPHMRYGYVGQIQAALKKHGFYKKAVDNDFGSGTNDAVVAFQRKMGLTVDGEVQPGGETAIALGI